MLDHTRFEIMPFGRVEEESAGLPERVRLTVTCSPKYGVDRAVEVGTQLRAIGHRVTVHLAARMVRDRKHLDEVLVALAESGADDIFLIGGDAASQQGPYASAMEVLQIIHDHRHRPRTIGIGGYPEGHPQIDSGRLLKVLKEKEPLADYITTQLCFEPHAVVDWARTIRDAGIGLPIIVGLPGIVERYRLLEIAVRIGVGPSLGYLRKQGGLGKLMRLSEEACPELHKALLPLVGDPQLGVIGFHYFTFNRLLDTWRWEREYSRNATI